MISKEKIIEHLDQMIESCRDVKAEGKIHDDAKSLASLIIGDCNRLKRKIEHEHLQLITE